MGETALHIAIHNEHLSVIETLLKRGASLTILDQNKFTPLSLAEHKKNDAVLQLINKYQKSSNRYNLFSDNRYNQISNNQFNKSTKYGQHFHVTRRRNKY
jgi:ankyrin repeat protein